MTKKVLSVVSLAVAFAILVPLSMVTSASEVNCRVPFSFIVGGQTLPAGLYSVSTGQGHMTLRGLRHSAVVLPMSGREQANGQARLVFLKTGDRYDLTEVWAGDGTGSQLPPAKRKGESRLASNAPAEHVVVLADAAAGSR